MWDRLLAYDSTTTGVAQLVYKAHLRTLSVEGLREAIAMGGQAMNGILAQVNQIRGFQSLEGLTLLDATDKFETHHYTFSGLDAVLVQFGEQLCGAVEIPAVRLFGQSPAGFNSGDNDLRSYYDSIKQNQVADLGPGIEKLYQIGYVNQFGTAPPKVFDLEFEHLWQMSEEQKAGVANTTTAAINTAYESQIIDRATAMRALQELSRTTGTFQIDDTKVAEAENDPAPTPEALGLELPEKPTEPTPPGATVPKKAKLTSDAIGGRLARIWARLFRTVDEEWHEQDHPRDNTGKFAEKAGGAAAWKKVGESQGSNPGGVYENDGQKYYAKFYANSAQGANEVMAARITELFGIKTTYPEIKEIDGKKAVVSELKDLKKIDWPGAVDSLTEKQRIQLARIYYVAKLTKNWDVLGVDNSNIMMDQKGDLVQMDTGGTFEFRAKGKPKPYGPDISDTNLLNPAETSGKVFNKLNQHDMVVGRNVVYQEYNENFGAIKTIFAINDQQKLGENFIKRVQDLEQHAKPPKPAEPKKGEPGYRDIHGKIRDAMKKAASASTGTEASRYVAEVIKVPPPPVTPEIKNALNEYVSSSGTLNNILRDRGGDFEKINSTSLVEQIKVLDKAIAEARDYSQVMRFMRGIPDHVVPSLKPGDTFVDHGYQSTTFSQVVADEFKSGAVLNIRLPKGFKFLTVPSFAKAVEETGGHFSSHAAHEAEAILPRGVGYRVKKIEHKAGHKVLHVDAIFSSLQPPRDKWRSSRSTHERYKKES